MKTVSILIFVFLFPAMLFAQTLTNEDYGIIAFDGSDNDFYGTSVSISDDYAIVGAPNYDDSINGVDAGAAYVYHYDNINDEWDFEVKLTADDGGAGDQFGRQVCVYKDWFIVGAHNNTHNGLSQAGAAYVYHKNSLGVWVENKLTANDAQASDHYGRAVGIYGQWIIVGALDEDTQGSNAGSAYIYKLSLGTIYFDQQIFGGSIGAGDNFGQCVSVYDNYAAIGSMYDDDNGTNAGAAYIFYRSTSWNQQAKLLPSDGAANDWFGNAICINENNVVIGAMMEDEGGYNSGAAYVFNRNTTTWTQVNKLVPTYASSEDKFGGTVGIYRDRIIVSGMLNNTTYTDAGLTYFYEFDSGTNSWNLTKYLQPSDVAGEDWFGRGGYIWGERVIIGSSNDHNTNGTDAGQVYIFDFPYPGKSLMYDENSSINSNNYKSSGINIYPNPFINTISINSDSEISNIDIIDISGKKVISLSEVPQNQNIDLSSLKSGIYIIRIKQNEVYSYHQLIKE